jgi:hypothetical protein
VTTGSKPTVAGSVALPTVAKIVVALAPVSKSDPAKGVFAASKQALLQLFLLNLSALIFISPISEDHWDVV